MEFCFNRPYGRAPTPLPSAALTAPPPASPQPRVTTAASRGGSQPYAPALATTVQLARVIASPSTNSSLYLSRQVPSYPPLFFLNKRHTTQTRYQRWHSAAPPYCLQVPVQIEAQETKPWMFAEARRTRTLLTTTEPLIPGHVLNHCLIIFCSISIDKKKFNCTGICHTMLKQEQN